MAELLSIVSTASYVAAVLFGVLALVFWFLFKIPSVIGDLSGRNAKKSIEKMRVNNVQTGNKTYRSSNVNKKRGKLTEKMEGAKTVPEKNYETGILMENRARSQSSEMTTLLVEEETGLLDQKKTIKNNQGVKGGKKRAPSAIKIKLLEEVIFLHTDEKV